MITLSRRSIRCAVYTRKSSEEGLEQSFNSLDAQREACHAYILSQLQEGWRAIDTQYDDGGFSGGSMVRPGLKQLLADIDAKKIDTVVVYKVDRLTRSLADFAKIIEVFDARGVSFVSVTQQFNTTTSMGRLTLNVLLSFAQFEREVTGERIRDKIAASKRKGMWMGGVVPLGYDVKDRHLVVNESEAKQVREIFRIYLELGCVRQLKARLDQNGTRSKARLSRAGNHSGDSEYSRGGLYKILQNRVYLGEISHKEQSYPGEHVAIVEHQLWDDVRAKMVENAYARRNGSNHDSPSLLRGLVYGEDGSRFTPSHTVKRGKRYRYYVLQRPDVADGSASTRIPARELERVVLSELVTFLSSPDRLLSEFPTGESGIAEAQRLVSAAGRLARSLERPTSTEVSETLASLVSKILVGSDRLEILMDRRSLMQGLGRQQQVSQHQEGLIGSEEPVRLAIPTRLGRTKGELHLIVDSSTAEPDIDPPVVSLVKAVSRAHEWVTSILSGEYKDQRAIAAATGLNERYVSRVISCAFLAPEIVETIVEGRQGTDLTLGDLLASTQMIWSMQRANQRTNSHQLVGRPPAQSR